MAAFVPLGSVIVGAAELRASLHPASPAATPAAKVMSRFRRSTCPFIAYLFVGTVQAHRHVPQLFQQCQRVFGSPGRGGSQDAVRWGRMKADPEARMT